MSIGLVVFGCGAAFATDIPVPVAETVEVEAPHGEPALTITIAPYGWAAGMTGDVAQFGLPAVEVDASFSDILDHLDFAAMMVGEIRYDRFGVLMDLMYVKLSGAAGTPHGILAGSVSVDSESLIFTAAGEYRLYDGPKGSVDVFAGARVWSVDTEVSFDGGVLDGVSRSDGDTWVDPLVGVKGRLDLTSQVFLSGWAMAGGFGVSSDFMWDLWGGLGYQFTDSFAAVAGYRATGVDYEKHGFVFDVVQHGPVIGGVFRF